MNPIHKIGGTLCQTCRVVISREHTHDLFCDNCLKNKHKCECGNVAVWWYAPGYKDEHDGHHCDDCVPRSCTCNHNYLAEEYDNTPEGEEGKDWKWIEKDVSWCYIDDQGREMPCAEYWYDQEGWEI